MTCLMVAWMNDEALARTLQTRGPLAFAIPCRTMGQGATSGHTQH